MAVDRPNRMKWNAQHFEGKEIGPGEQLSRANIGLTRLVELALLRWISYQHKTECYQSGSQTL